MSAGCVLEAGPAGPTCFVCHRSETSAVDTKKTNSFRNCPYVAGIRDKASDAIVDHFGNPRFETTGNRHCSRLHGFEYSHPESLESGREYENVMICIDGFHFS